MKPICMAGSTSSHPQAARLPKKRSRASRKKRARQTVSVVSKGLCIRASYCESVFVVLVMLNEGATTILSIRRNFASSADGMLAT